MGEFGIKDAWAITRAGSPTGCRTYSSIKPRSTIASRAEALAEFPPAWIEGVRDGQFYVLPITSLTRGRESAQ
jgi:hypothetical protein